MAKARRQFHRAAQRQNPAVFDFEREVAQAWQDFPQVKDKIFFLDAGNGAKLVYPANDAGKEKAQELLLKVNPQKVLDRFWQNGKNSFCMPYFDLRFLFLLTGKHPHDVTDKAAPVAQETTFIFDHELAHAIIPNGSYRDGNKNRAESIADAYAVIRHFQRYGADSHAVDAIVANRAFDFIFREAVYGHSHFSSPVTEKILVMRYKVDWDNLTPAQTAKMARELVLEHEMDAEALRVLHKDFERLNDKAKDIERGDILPIRQLAKKVLSTDSSNVFKYGAAALKLCIDQQTVKGFSARVQRCKLRRKLAKRQQHFMQPHRSQVMKKF